MRIPRCYFDVTSGKGKCALAFDGEIVKEYSAHTAGLGAVGDPKVAIAPRLPHRIKVKVVLVGSLLESVVEMCGIAVEEIDRCEVCAAAEPPSSGLIGVLRVIPRIWRAIGQCGRMRQLEVAIVEVYCGCHGVARVDDKAETGGKEGQAFDIGFLSLCDAEIVSDLLK